MVAVEDILFVVGLMVMDGTKELFDREDGSTGRWYTERMCCCEQVFGVALFMPVNYRQCHGSRDWKECVTHSFTHDRLC